MDKVKFNEIGSKIMKCWDQTTIYPGLLFNPTSPATGQCEPTVCLVQDIFGGDIYKITGDKSIAPKKTHYYNCIDGQFIDLTSAQFKNTIPYKKGIKLTDKESNMLRRTSYCNRMVRYQCLKNNFDNIDLRNVGYFFEDAGKKLMNAPWDEIMNYFPQLFKLITFVMDCKYDRSVGLFDNDTMRIIEHYLQGYYETDSDQIIEELKDKIINKNGQKFK